MEQVKEVEKLLNNRKFEEAEKILFPLYQKNRKDSIINYFLGLFYNDFSNPKKSTKMLYNISEKPLLQKNQLKRLF